MRGDGTEELFLIGSMQVDTAFMAIDSLAGIFPRFESGQP